MAGASPSFDEVDHSMVGLAIAQAEINGPIWATRFTERNISTIMC